MYILKYGTFQQKLNLVKKGSFQQELNVLKHRNFQAGELGNSGCPGLPPAMETPDEYEKA
jgi:hypothetical protein